VIVVACVPVAATPVPPDDSQGVLRAIARRGVTFEGAIAGETGCADPTLAGNAIVFQARLGGAAARPVYLFRFRNRRAWEASAAAVDQCLERYAAQAGRPPGSIARIDVSPYRAFGPGWEPELETLLGEALAEAARGGGGPSASPSAP
jgi:hypothetical protein